MTNDAAILTLSQWFSPAYPVGAFAYSHGLEWSVEAGEVNGSEALRGWIGAVLQSGAGRSDAIFLAAAFHAKDEDQVSNLNQRCRAFANSKERLAETENQGTAFCAVTNSVWGDKIHGLTYPVAVGSAARSNDLPLALTSSMYLQAFASNLVSAGIRLGLLGQTAGHQLIRDFGPLALEIATDTADGDLNTLSSTAFLSDIASMKHETQYSRIFRT